MSTFPHKHTTRLKTGVLKRKYIKDYYSDVSSNDSSSDSDFETENELESDIDDMEKNNTIDNEYIENKILAKDKLQYYKFLNKLFPSNYSINKINKIKRQRLYNSPKIKKNIYNKSKKFNKSYYDSDNDDELEEKVHLNSSLKHEGLKKLFENDNKNINIIVNMKACKNNIINNDHNIPRYDFQLEQDLPNYYIKDNKYENHHNLHGEHDHEDEDDDKDDDEDNDEDEDEDDDEDDDEDEDEDEDEDQDEDEDEVEDEDDKDEDEGDDKDDIKNQKLRELSKKLVEYKSKNIIKELVNIANQEKNKYYKKNPSNIDSSEELENTIISSDEKNTIVPPPKNISSKNYKKFSKILTEEDKESKYFKKNMSIKEQEKAIEKLTVIKNLTSIETPYLIHLINIDIPDIYKACALKKINMLREMGEGFSNGEYYKVKAWVDTFIKIPFNKYNNLPITFADGIDQCHSFMQNAKNTLDTVVYGLDDAKIQIMQLIGLWLVNPNAVGSAIAIKGPMGTGKTTLIKEGISKILNRPFSLIALGGCSDSGFLDGHDYTYEGSKYGKIIDILIQSRCMNPVILFDELDKISDTPKGEEIVGVLTHLTDITQNSQFVDKYMSEISLDMSKALYIFSYNDESRINPILKDRMYKIETKGYKIKEKLVICNNYLIPKIYEIAKFKKEDVIFSDEILEYIIKDFTENEAGVRNLKRCLEIIYTKLNLYRLMKPDENIFKSSLKIDKKVEFPFEIKQDIVDKLLNKTNKNDIPFGMYN